MAAERRNIVQAEFFHVGKGALSPDTFIRELVGRVADGAPIKTVVRFFDANESITNFVLKYRETEEERQGLVGVIVSSKRLKRMFANRKHRTLTKKRIAMMEERKSLAVRELALRMKTSGEIAIECSDHSFRLMRDDERHELLESAQAAVNAWLFIFQPNDLLADSNELVSWFVV